MACCWSARRRSGSRTAPAGSLDHALTPAAGMPTFSACTPLHTTVCMEQTAAGRTRLVAAPACRMLMVFCVLLIVVPLCLPNNLTSVRTQPINSTSDPCCPNVPKCACIR